MAAAALIIVVDVTIVALSIGLHWRVHFLLAELAALAALAVCLRARREGLRAVAGPGADGLLQSHASPTSLGQLPNMIIV